MSITREEAQSRVELSVQALRDAGLRLTHQRFEIVREIAGSDEHPDVETVYRAVRTKVPTISLDTVYRTLASLTDLGQVGRVDAATGPNRYDANMTHHHHFVCVRCGSIRDVVDERLDAVNAPAGIASLGTVESVDVRFRGVCKECVEKGAG